VNVKIFGVIWKTSIESLEMIVLFSGTLVELYIYIDDDGPDLDVMKIYYIVIGQTQESSHVV
jgi:hypothetical protein